MAGVQGDGDLARDAGFAGEPFVFSGEVRARAFAVTDRFAVFKALQVRLCGELALGQTGFHGAQAEAGGEIERERTNHAARRRADAKGLDHPNTLSFIVSSHAQA